MSRTVPIPAAVAHRLAETASYYDREDKTIFPDAARIGMGPATFGDLREIRDAVEGERK